MARLKPCPFKTITFKTIRRERGPSTPLRMTRQNKDQAWLRPCRFKDRAHGNIDGDYFYDSRNWQA
jgi:hypothetical protein